MRATSAPRGCVVSSHRECWDRGEFWTEFWGQQRELLAIVQKHGLQVLA
jgi:hypothetical protein